jgi:FtsH-binding integral membrane protein
MVIWLISLVFFLGFIYLIVSLVSSKEGEKQNVSQNILMVIIVFLGLAALGFLTRNCDHSDNDPLDEQFDHRP